MKKLAFVFASVLGGFLGCAILLAASSGVGIQIQQAGSPIATYVGGQVVLNCSTNVTCSAAGNVITVTASGTGGGLASGAIVMVNSGSCPTGFTEDDTFNALYLLGTKASNSDAGTTGGSLSYTPAGSNSAATFTGTAGTIPAETISYPANVPAFTGTSGTVPAETFTGSATTVPALGAGTLADATSGSTHKLFTSSSSGVSAATLTGSTATGTLTPLGSNSTVSFTPAGTIAWPANPPTNGTASFTPAGTNSAATFSGTPATIQPSFEKVLFCKKT